MWNINVIIIILLENIYNLQIRSSACGLCNHKYEYTCHRICIREICAFLQSRASSNRQRTWGLKLYLNDTRGLIHRLLQFKNGKRDEERYNTQSY